MVVSEVEPSLNTFFLAEDSKRISLCRFSLCRLISLTGLQAILHVIPKVQRKVHELLNYLVLHELVENLVQLTSPPTPLSLVIERIFNKRIKFLITDS